MKGFIQEYGNIIVVVAVILLMLLFGKSGYAKNIQDAILGSADHIVETGQNITKKEVNVKAGDTLDIEGNKYIVLEKQGNYQVLVMTASSIGKKAFQSNYDDNTKLRQDGQNANTYEGSEIDNYLENDWYNSLSSTMKVAIQSINIKQASHSSDSPDVEQGAGYNSQVYNTISRHVFLPSIKEMNKVVDLKNLKNLDKVKAFLNGTSIWTRDSYQGNAYIVEYLEASIGHLFDSDVNYTFGVRPAFVIDLSKVDYKVTGHVDYK